MFVQSKKARDNAAKEMQLIDKELQPLNKKIEKIKSEITTLKNSLKDHVSIAHKIKILFKKYFIMILLMVHINVQDVQ